MAKPKFIPPVKKGMSLELSVETLASSGDGICRYEGYTLFVPEALPGDRVRAEVIKITPRFGVVRVKTYLTRSADRVDPPCPVFPQCGGCRFQDYRYEKQLEFKIRVVTDSLKHLGKIEFAGDIEAVPADPVYHYRNKASFAVQEKSGKRRIGFFQEGTHEVVDSDTCDVLVAPLNDVKEWIRDLLVRHRVSLYEERKHRGFLRGLVVRHSQGTGETLVGLVTTSGRFSADFLRDLTDPVRLDRFRITGIVQNLNPKDTNVILGPKNRVLWGENRMIEKLGDLSFPLSLGSFFQVHTPQARRLYELVQGWVEAVSGPVLDAYCGAGGIALWLAHAGQEVIGIEEFPPAVKDAEEGARLNRLDRCRFVAGRVEEHLPPLAALVNLGTLIVDPPRKGCSEEVVKTVSRLAPEQVIYISCNPATLARDLSRLEGYRIQEIRVVDLFPQTQHVETAVRLRRK